MEQNYNKKLLKRRKFDEEDEMANSNHVICDDDMDPMALLYD